MCDYWASRRVYLDKHYLKHRVIYCCAVCDQRVGITWLHHYICFTQSYVKYLFIHFTLFDFFLVSEYNQTYGALDFCTQWCNYFHRISAWGVYQQVGLNLFALRELIVCFVVYFCYGFFVCFVVYFYVIVGLLCVLFLCYCLRCNIFAFYYDSPFFSACS